MPETRKAAFIPCMSSRNPTPAQGDLAGSAPTTTYKLAIGDRVEKLEGDEFKLIQSGIIIVRESQTTLAS